MNFSSLKIEHVLSFGMFVLVPLCVFAPAGLTAWLLVITTLSVAVTPSKKDLFKGISPYLMGLIGLFIMWAAITSFWSLDPKQTLINALRLGAMMATGLLLLQIFKDLSREQRHFIYKFFMTGFVLGLILLALEVTTQGLILTMFTGGQTLMYKYNRAATLLAILIWPAIQIIFVLYNKPQAFSLAIPLFLLTGFILFTLDCDAAKLAFALGGLIWSLSFLFKKHLGLSLSLLVIIGFLTSPLLHKTILDPQQMPEFVSEKLTKPSAYHRLYIWNYVASRITERPILGWGLDSSRHDHFAKDMVTWTQPNPNKVSPSDPDSFEVTLQALSLHPHNAALQLWLELGLPGVILFLVFIARIPLQIQRLFKDQLSKASAFAAFTSSLVISMLSYGLWQTPWISSLWIGAILIYAIARDEHYAHL